jgi:hypothetical protein
VRLKPIKPYKIVAYDLVLSKSITVRFKGDLMKGILFALPILCFSGYALGFPYQIDTVPSGAHVVNVVTNEQLGITPLTVNVSDTEHGSTFGISFIRYENVAVRIVKVLPSAENGFQISPPAVASMSMPGKAPLEVKTDDNAALIQISMRPIMSEPVTPIYTR